jgi:two-component system sensor kinase FixL
VAGPLVDGQHRRRAAASGLFVFRPMVRRVRHDMDLLKQFNETLEARVAERTALAERRADALAKSQRKLVKAERLAAIGEMVAGVAHESRNALQEIQACSGLLEWRINGDREACELLADLRKAQLRLHRLFEDLRGYAAPLKLDLQACNLSDVVSDAWTALAPLRQRRDATLRTRLSNGEACCRGDPIRLGQVFRNIMENALSACADPMQLDVEFAQTTLGGAAAVAISVRDNGPGFKPDELSRVFEPFYTTKTQGCGLGLSIVKRIVEAHEGEIHLANHQPQGAEIRIVLPKGT